MTETHATLSAHQLRRVELALSGFARGVVTLTFPGLEAENGETVILHDEEGTDVVAIPKAAVNIHASRADVVPQIGTGTAPLLPSKTTVAGTVKQLRPLGHRDHTELRAASGNKRVHRAVLITGSVPKADDALWVGAPDPVIVLDRGDSAQLASAISAVERVNRTAIVLPHVEELSAGKVAHEIVADVVETWNTPVEQPRGRVILLTGLSGSGKSTIAKHLVERLSSTDSRTTTLLDGDEVRQILSKGLGFSVEDRMLNVQRIGWVASLIARHDGIAVCAPIAPFEAMRSEMRDRVEEHGRFLLVHISTPLDVCEQRDRKGLYAKARAGEILHFTGVSDPYQIPTDADLTIDASLVDPESAVDRIIKTLTAVDGD